MGSDSSHESSTILWQTEKRLRAEKNLRPTRQMTIENVTEEKYSNVRCVIQAVVSSAYKSTV